MIEVCRFFDSMGNYIGSRGFLLIDLVTDRVGQQETNRPDFVAALKL